ncbi:MAG TPA: thiamine-phosphate kinase [Planctomycetaceae bacterium]|nr:thiamine-phosphate kinase [Planctomycetaceae bacterium]
MEQSFVAWAKVRAARLPQVKLGIGDDAAVLAGDTKDWVITTDSLMDGVHFRLQETNPRRIGRKLVNVNLSDLAAMAAQPVAVFLTLCLPDNGAGDMAADALAAEIYEAVCEVCQRRSISLAGGDTNCWSGPLVLNMTAVGKVENNNLWTRSGAKPGDCIVVTGPLGGSLLGKHLDFEPRLDVVHRLQGFDLVNAAMDISDGLSTDLLRLCDASRCGAVLELADIPISPAAQQMGVSSVRSSLDHALGDGEDFELLLAVPSERLLELRLRLEGVCQPVVCGQFTSRTGLRAQDRGKIVQLTSTGYVHGSSRI